MHQAEEKNVKRTSFQICFLLFMVSHLVCLCFFGTRKINYHIDEYFTYALANKENASMPEWPEWENQKVYTGDTFFSESLMPNERERFQYPMVWENQKNDVHPPLYYVLVHTVCSLFPGAFSKWQGLAVNFAMWLVIDCLVYLIAKQLFKNQWTALLAAVINAVSLMSLNAALYLRMYSMMTVFVLAITALLLTYRKKKKDRKFYIGLVLLSAGGALTQYYFLIYLFFICLTFGVSLLIEKKWKDAAGFVAALAGAGAVSIAVFPAMVTQIFGGSDRGAEAFENARTLPNMLARLKSYYDIINREVFGGWFAFFVILAVIFVLVSIVKHWKVKDSVQEILLFLPSAVLYSMVVAVISPYMEDRYVMAMGPLYVLAGIWLVYYLFVQTGKERTVFRANCVTAVVFTVVTGFALRSAGWMPAYTYQSTKDKLYSLHWYDNCSVIYVYDNSWTVNDNMEELKRYKDYTFVSPAELADFVQGREDEMLILYNESLADNETVINTVMSANSKLTESVKLFQNSAESIYLLK